MGTGRQCLAQPLSCQAKSSRPTLAAGRRCTRCVCGHSAPPAPAWWCGSASPEQWPLGNMFMEGPPMPAARSGSTLGTSNPAVRYLWVQYRFMGCRQLKPRQPAGRRRG